MPKYSRTRIFLSPTESGQGIRGRSRKGTGKDVGRTRFGSGDLPALRAVQARSGFDTLLAFTCQECGLENEVNATVQ